MQVYANNFFAAINTEKSELVLNFIQNIPTASPPSPEKTAPGEISVANVEALSSEPVAQLVMTIESGQQLLSLLTKVYEDINSNADET